MQTTWRGKVAPYIGADLTDSTALVPRSVDVCGLTPVGERLVASFWEWRWAGEGTEDIVAELRAARCSMLDGPQALAAPGRSMRECDRLSGAAGKTPDRRERVVGKPFAGFVLSSIDLFGCLAAAGLAVSPVGFVGGVGEVYPADLWKRLHRGLAKKGTPSGIAQRRAVLEVCGVTLPPSDLSHDQLDAAVAALVAAAADGSAPGLSVQALGDPLQRRPDGALQEGPMAILALNDQLRERVALAVGTVTVTARPARGIAGSGLYRCPISGCSKEFIGSRGGWDGHVGAFRLHPQWHPEIPDEAARKRLFKEEFPKFFGRS